MNTDKIKERINDILSQLDPAIKLFKTFGASEYKIEILEDLEYFLQRLLEHLQVLETEKSLAVLEVELRETSLTLQGLRETLLLWEPVDEELLSEVDEAQATVLRLLDKVKSGRRTKAKAPALLMFGIIGFAAYKSKKR